MPQPPRHLVVSRQVIDRLRAGQLLLSRRHGSREILPDSQGHALHCRQEHVTHFALLCPAFCAFSCLIRRPWMCIILQTLSLYPPSECHTPFLQGQPSLYLLCDLTCHCPCLLDTTCDTGLCLQAIVTQCLCPQLPPQITSGPRLSLFSPCPRKS